MTPYWGRVLAACAWLLPVVLLIWYSYRYRIWRLTLATLPPLYVVGTYLWLAHRTVAHLGDVSPVLTWFQVGQIQMGLYLGLVIYFLGRPQKRGNGT